DVEAGLTRGGASNKPTPATKFKLAPAAPWFVATDADDAGERAAADWLTSGRAHRVRPPEPDKDWTEVHQGGFNRLRYYWTRLLRPAPSWAQLAGQPSG